MIFVYNNYQLDEPSQPPSLFSKVVSITTSSSNISSVGAESTTFPNCLLIAIIILYDMMYIIIHIMVYCCKIQFCAYLGSKHVTIIKAEDTIHQSNINRLTCSNVLTILPFNTFNYLSNTSIGINSKFNFLYST